MDGPISPKAEFKLPDVQESMVYHISNFHKIRTASRRKLSVEIPKTGRKIGFFKTSFMELDPIAPSQPGKSSVNVLEEDQKDEQKKSSIPEVDVYSMRFSPDSSELAIGCTDGTIRIVDPQETKLLKILNNTQEQVPTTCVRYRPTVGASQKTRNVIVSSTGDGKIQHWHVPSQKKIFELEEKGNTILALDYSCDSELFASGGQDKVVRVYEEGTKSLLTELKMGLGSRDSDGHSQRIYCVKFHPRDPNMILSSGWDDTVHVWDIRAGCSVKKWDGPHVCADSLDIFEDVVLTGSWREREGLQVWDLGTGKLLKTIDFHRKDKQETETDHIYGAAFSMDGDFIAAGGSFTSETRIFDVRHNFRRVDKMRTKAKGVYSVTFSNSGRNLASGSKAGKVSILDMMPEMEEDDSRQPKAEESEISLK